MERADHSMPVQRQGRRAVAWVHDWEKYKETIRQHSSHMTIKELMKKMHSEGLMVEELALRQKLKEWGFGWIGRVGFVQANDPISRNGPVQATNNNHRTPRILYGAAPTSGHGLTPDGNGPTNGPIQTLNDAVPLRVAMNAIHKLQTQVSGNTGNLIRLSREIDAIKQDRGIRLHGRTLDVSDSTWLRPGDSQDQPVVLDDDEPYGTKSDAGGRDLAATPPPPTPVPAPTSTPTPRPPRRQRIIFHCTRINGHMGQPADKPCDRCKEAGKECRVYKPNMEGHLGNACSRCRSITRGCSFSNRVKQRPHDWEKYKEIIHQNYCNMTTAQLFGLLRSKGLMASDRALFLKLNEWGFNRKKESDDPSAFPYDTQGDPDTDGRRGQSDASPFETGADLSHDTAPLSSNSEKNSENHSDIPLEQSRQPLKRIMPFSPPSSCPLSKRSRISPPNQQPDDSTERLMVASSSFTDSDHKDHDDLPSAYHSTRRIADIIGDRQTKGRREFQVIWDISWVPEDELRDAEELNQLIREYGEWKANKQVSDHDDAVGSSMSG